MSNQVNVKQVWEYIGNIVKQFPLGISVMVIVSVVGAIDLSLRPYLLKIILDHAASEDVANIFSNLAVPAILYIGINLLLSTCYRFYDYFANIKMKPAMRKKIAQESFSALLEKSHQFYLNEFSGSLANKVKDLIKSIPLILEILIDSFLFNSLSILIAIITLAQVNLVFAGFMFLWAVIFVVGSIYFSKYFLHLADNVAANTSVITGKIVDSLSNILLIRLFSAKKYEEKYLNHNLTKAQNSEEKLFTAYFWLWFVYGYSFCIAQMLNLYFLVKGRQEGWVTVGDFALVFMINISIANFLWNVAREISQFSELLGRVMQGLKSISDPIHVEDIKNAKKLKVTKGEIKFEGVNFHYKGPEPLFKDKSITIHPGQKVGLVGYSGGGKTTFANLILRLYDVSGGKISIDGQDISEVTQDSLHSAIGMIPQESTLFHRSLMDNIRYGMPDATDEQVKLAAKKAHADEFIEALEDGYETLVGERGVKLSGGQRQRISIARAALKNAPILILDEATSQLDSITEGIIQESIWHLMQGKTTLIIAHRLSTLLYMDRILVFDKGRIVEDGTHQELLARDGLYKTLWNSQVGGFLQDSK